MKILRKINLVKILCLLVLIALIIYISIGVYSFSIVSKYDDKIFPNVYVNNHDISGLDKDNVVLEVNKIRDEVENKEIVLNVNNNEYKYRLKDVGISINSDDLANEILTYTNDLSYLDQLQKISLQEKTLFNYKYTYEKEKLSSFFENLKTKVDCKVVEGKLVDNNHTISYIKGTPSFSLDVSKNVDYFIDNLSDIIISGKANLIGESVQPKNSNLSTINKKMSSFTTTFDTKISRAKNLVAGAKLLNGTILQPNEVFSFYKFAGPYSGQKGYVYYSGVMGSGVCQVATTMYNAYLLAGLKTVQRYSHAYKMWYVDGGLDATVAANKFGATVDLKFKNTYKYPVYISAYTTGGNLTIELWSNENATDGKTYKTESKKIGYNGYNTYLITYKDGKQIDRKFIDSTWYPK